MKGLVIIAKPKIGKHGLPQTTGNFRVRGEVIGTSKENFFKTSIQKNKLQRNTISFAVKSSIDNEVYVEVSDSEKEKAYFFKSNGKGEKGEVKSIAWSKRTAPIRNKKGVLESPPIIDFDENENLVLNNYIENENGFNAIGVSVGLLKDESGKNVTKTFLDYDAAEVLSVLIEEGSSILIVGETDFSSMETNEGIKRYKKLRIKKIYNSAVNFEAEDFKEESVFQQRFIFTGIEPAKKDGEVDKEDRRWIVSGKIINYNSIEDVEFVIRKPELAKNYKKRIKPYTAITVSGRINNRREEEIVVNEDDWGGEEVYEVVNSPRKFEFEIVSGASNIDATTYTEAVLNEAFKPQEEYNSFDSDDDDDPWGDDEDEELDFD